ncbi:hypothetical protein AB4Z54_12295, partial [Streptomyces sp. MCAF7]
MRFVGGSLLFRRQSQDAPAVDGELRRGGRVAGVGHRRAADGERLIEEAELPVGGVVGVAAPGVSAGLP